MTQTNIFEYSWKDLLEKEFTKDYYNNIIRVVQKDSNAGILCPDIKDIYRSFELTPFESIKVVIIGQDPYHDGNADGLAFSCKNYLTPSLKNIYESLDDTFGKKDRPINLDSWASQGVFLLNSCLTTTKGQANAHSKLGWQGFTAKCVRAVAQNKIKIVFLLWGSFAHLYEPLIKMESSEHLIIKCEHPAAASYQKRKWFNADCFQRTNEYLTTVKRPIINW